MTTRFREALKYMNCPTTSISDVTVNPSWNTLNLTNGQGSSHYAGLQAGLNRRLSHGCVQNIRSPVRRPRCAPPPAAVAALISSYVRLEASSSDRA